VSTTQTAVTRVSLVVVPVTDHERAIAFYTEVLGLEKRTDVSMGDQYRWVEVAPAGGETSIAIVPPPPGQPAGNVQTGICLHTDDIDGYHERLRAAGADVDAEISRMGDPVPPLFWFREPDANTLMVAG
jgi:predicted enzyme related to lactoylglutathione lyase